MLAGCGGGGSSGGGGGVDSTPPPAGAAPPPPAPAPAAAPPPPAASATPAATFDTAEYRRSDGPSFHNAVPAWQLGATGRGVAIGIVDSGIDPGNPEFTGRISPASSDVAGGRGVSDENGHGTMVALIAGAARNGTGIMGIAWESTLIGLRADTPGSCASVVAGDRATGCKFNDGDIARGIDRAVQGGARVINLSLGGSAPSPTLNSAVGRAAAAGVVVVVAAGNDADEPEPGTDPSNPDPFASGLRQAGNGNVIIAGSVNDAGQISDFSNRAGGEASSYLMGLGDRVCCKYENGAIKTFVENGQTFVYVVSGTSFAAPQISGAVALLRQAFPNLTAQQVVDLLLRTARDAGSPGTDATYGRGILDIGNAFAPQGATTLAGGSSPMVLSSNSIVASPAMGDATARGESMPAIVLDSYQRAYRIDLAAQGRGAQLAPRLTQALTGSVRQVSAAAGPVALAFSVDGRRTAASAGQLRLGAADAERAQVMAAQAVTRLSKRTSVAFGYAQAADGLTAQLRGAAEPAFLIARSPTGDSGGLKHGDAAVAVRHRIGPWGLTVSGERGQSVSGAPVHDLLPVDRRRREDTRRIGIALDRTWGGLDTVLAASWMDEERTVLGARLNPALGPRGADTVFIDASAAWRFAPEWRLGMVWRQGYTAARSGGFVAQGSRLASDAWSIDLARSSLFTPGDQLAFRVSQPLRVRSGGLRLDLPVAYSYDTLAATRGLVDLSLAPKGRELDAELAWNGPLWRGSASASLFYRKDPSHYAASPDDKGLAVSWRTRF